LKKKARDYTNRLVRKGVITRATICYLCGGKDPIEAHHLDYHQPRMVEWICRPCHKKHHGNERKAEKAAFWADVVKVNGIKPVADPAC
jgi:hypothetical protein